MQSSEVDHPELVTLPDHEEWHAALREEYLNILVNQSSSLVCFFKKLGIHPRADFRNWGLKRKRISNYYHHHVSTIHLLEFI